MSSATQNSPVYAATSSERSVHIEGAPLRYHEAGQGNPLLVLDDSGALRLSPLYGLLARRFRIITFDLSGAAPAASTPDAPGAGPERTLARAMAAIGLARYGVIGVAAATTTALRLALDAPDQVDGLVLISPTAASARSLGTPDSADRELAGRLGDLKPAALVLLGTEDRSVLPETGRIYAQRIPRCYCVLVYDDGRALAAERPDALFGTMLDFLEYRENFVVNRSSTVLNP